MNNKGANMFYSNEEFNAQVEQLMFEEDYSFPEACGIVQERMEQDEREYNEWRDEQEQQAEMEEEYRAVTGCDPAEYNDNWYDEQYELDTDYL
jgi:hypothetical protein